MKYFKQETNYTCAVACLRMVISHFEEEVPSEEELAAELETNDQIGTHPEKLAEVAIKRGYNVLIGNKAKLHDLDHLRDKGCAIVLLVSVDVPHLVVYLGNNNNHAFFHDPFFGENVAHRVKYIEKGDNVQYPLFRWRIVSKEFEKYWPYSFESYESQQGYIAFQKIK
jgi:ABC-type bacteriocin/lantibiotic exporter with double-glycine peptidase domain